MSQPPPYGLLLVAGSQTHQENYARAFAAEERCRIVGLADEADVPERRRELNRQLAAELDVPLLDDLDAALARGDVDFVSICAEPDRRGRIAVKAARAGKHLYLDKEPADTLQEAREIAIAAEEGGVLTQTFSLVRTPAAQRAREVVQSGELGRLVGLHCELFFAKGIAGSADLSRPRREKAEPGRLLFVDAKRELLCVGWYPLVLFQWLAGGRFARIFASTSNYFFESHQRNDVEDFACAMLEMTGGVRATITVGRTGWSSHPGHGVHQIHLVGTDGVATIDAYRPRLEIHSDAPAWSQPAEPHPQDPMGFWSSTQKAGGVDPRTDWHPLRPAVESDAACFLDCIERGRPSDVPAESALHTLEAVFAGYESAARGEWIALPPQY